jgi:hypothetical protein
LKKAFEEVPAAKEKPAFLMPLVALATSPQEAAARETAAFLEALTGVKRGASRDVFAREAAAKLGGPKLDLQTLLDAVAIQRGVTEGEKILARIARAPDANAVVACVEELRKVALGLSSLVSELGTLNADALVARGKQAARRRTAELRAASLQLTLQAVLHDPRPEGRSGAIVRHDGVSRIYSEQDALKDKAGEPVPGIKVVKIVPGSVELDVDGERLALSLDGP